MSSIEYLGTWGWFPVPTILSLGTDGWFSDTIPVAVDSWIDVALLAEKRYYLLDNEYREFKVAVEKRSYLLDKEISDFELPYEMRRLLLKGED
jgi:hypothetical protein